MLLQASLVCNSPLPCWADLSRPRSYRNRVTQMVAEIEEAAAAERKRTGKAPLAQAIAQDPWTQNRSLALILLPQDWPGVHCANALLNGESMTGHWFDRSREYAARNQGQDFERLCYATEEAVEFSPIPCWAHLPPEVYQARIKTLVDSVIAEAALERSRTGRPIEGVESILARDPSIVPPNWPAPPPRSCTPRRRPQGKPSTRCSWFVAAFRSAAEKLKTR